MDRFRVNWSIFRLAATLDARRSPKSIHSTCANKWMAAGAVGPNYQRVRTTFFAA